jgi:hypothetical protein
MRGVWCLGLAVARALFEWLNTRTSKFLTLKILYLGVVGVHIHGTLFQTSMTIVH